MSHGVQIEQNVNILSRNIRNPYNLIKLGLVTSDVSIYRLYAYNMSQDYIYHYFGVYGHDSVALRSIKKCFYAVER